MILVTGGTGLVGSHLLLQLLKDNKRIRALCRESSNLNQVKKVFGYYDKDADTLFSKIDWVIGDITMLPTLQNAFTNVTMVYHCAAYISFDPAAYKMLKKVNTVGTANIVNLCIANKVQKLCYTSSIAAIGHGPTDSIVTENNDWTTNDVNVYALTKYAAEMEVWRGAREGLSVAIVNPGVILGPGFWNKGSGKLFTTASKGTAFYPPGGTGFVDVQDVAKAMQALSHAKIDDQRYIMVAENCSYGLILAKISDQLGKKPPSKELKLWQLQIARVLDLIANRILGKKRLITKDSIKALAERQFYDNSKIKKDLNFTFTAVDTSIERYCKLFLQDHE